MLSSTVGKIPRSTMGFSIPHGAPSLNQRAGWSSGSPAAVCHAPRRPARTSVRHVSVAVGPMSPFGTPSVAIIASPPTAVQLLVGWPRLALAPKRLQQGARRRNRGLYNDAKPIHTYFVHSPIRWFLCSEFLILGFLSFVFLHFVTYTYLVLTVFVNSNVMFALTNFATIHPIQVGSDASVVW